jgi:alcohol dehydrogenase (cytochrome c)
VQVYSPGTHGMRGNPMATVCPSHFGAKNWEPTAYNPNLHLIYVPSVEGCDGLETVEEKSFTDQGGSLKPRDRFSGGSFKLTGRLYGSLKALDPTNGETKASVKLDFPNYAGALATAGNLVFLGEADGTFAAYDAKTLNKVWTYNVGTGINAPAVSYSVNGKQYVAVLAGSRQSPFVMQNDPQLKYTATSSMLFVFGLN